MKINEVLYLLRDDLENLPPSMSQVLTLCQTGHKVKVVTMCASSYIRDFYKDQPAEFISLYKENHHKKSVFSKIRWLVEYRKLVRKALENNPYDLLWIGSADTARYCKDMLMKPIAPVVLNIYELYDKNPEVINAIKPIAQNSTCVVVPEYNRAHILKVWLGLKKTPLVIPNKPCFPKVEMLPETGEIVDNLKKMNKKIVLYQGWIGKDRDVSKIACALNQLDNSDEYALVLLGTVTSPDTITKIQQIFEETVHISFLKPPQHLFITELANMGIATYDDSSLNNVFCAPNKIYEYAERNVPILARDIPGLASTVGKYHAGVCVDMDNIDDVAKAIQKISDDREKYVDSLKAFLDECSVEQSIARIIQTCEGTIH